MLAVVVTVVAAAVYIWLTWNHSYWRRRGVPYLPPSLLFGNLKDLVLLKDNSGVIYDKLYWKMPEEPAVGLFKLRQPQLLVRDAELVKTMLVTEFSSFHDNDIDVSSDDPILSLNPFVVKGEKWKPIRSVTASAITPGKVKGMVENMLVVCKDMIDYLNKNENTFLEAKFLGGQFTADVVTGCVYGLSSNSFKDPNSIYRKMISGVFKNDFFTNLRFMIVKIMPSLAKFMNVRFISPDVTSFFEDVIKKTVQYREKNSVRRNDYLQQLIDQKDKNEFSVGYSTREMAGHSLTFLLDGYETSSVLIGHLIDLLARHPQVQHKLRREISARVPFIDKLTYDVINSSPYLDAVVNEALRLRPPGPILTKKCTRDVEVWCRGRRYSVEKGMSVAIPILSIQTDPVNFPEPQLFSPERFLSEPSPPGFLPFGLGPRACLGSKFALTQVKACIIAIVKHFEIIPKDTSTPQSFAKESSVLLLMSGGVWVKFRRLRDEETLPNI